MVVLKPGYQDRLFVFFVFQILQEIHGIYKSKNMRCAVIKKNEMAKFYKFLTICILLFTTVVLHDFSNSGGQNMIMIGVMFLCVFVLPFRLKLFDFWDLLLFTIFLLEMTQSIIHPANFRLSTVLYSALFMVQFAMLKVLTPRYLRMKDYVKLIRGLIYLFTAVLILQQLSELVGVEGFNRNGLFSARWKMNSLAQEPSSLPPIIMLLLLSYTKMKELALGKSLSLKESIIGDKKLWFAGLYTSIGCGTTSGIFVVPIFLLYFFRKHLIKYLPHFAFLGGALVGAFAVLFPYAVERFVAILNVIGTMDPNLLYAADPSGSARIAPYMIAIQEFDLADRYFWLGHGVDYATFHFSSILVGQELDAEIGIGGIINFFYDYGAIAFLCFILYIRKYCFNSFWSFNFLLWVLVFSVSPFNTASAWFPLFYMMINNTFEKKCRNKLRL